MLACFLSRHLQLYVDCHLFFFITVLVCARVYFIVNICGDLRVPNINLHHFNSSINSATHRTARVSDTGSSWFPLDVKVNFLCYFRFKLPLLLAGTHLRSADKQERPVWLPYANVFMNIPNARNPLASPDYFLFMCSSSVRGVLLLWEACSRCLVKQNIPCFSFLFLFSSGGFPVIPLLCMKLDI